MKSGGTVLAVLAAVMLTGCAGFPVIGGPGAGRYPEACADWGFPERQCKAISAAAIYGAQVDPDHVSEIWLVPFERPQEANLGGMQIARVLLKLANGKEMTHDIWCGVSFSPTCNPDAEMGGGGSGLDHDVPCEPPPGGCATVPPTPPPEAFQHGRSLEIQALDIPIDRNGQHQIEIGKAVLPNGYLSERSFDIVDRRPTGFWTQRVALDIRSDIPGRPPAGNIHREPFDGPEPVTVYVVFEVTMFEAASTLQLRDIVVR